MPSPPEQPVIPAPIPPGFTLDVDGPDAIVIRHRRTGMGCMNAFLLIWLTVWTAACLTFFHLRPDSVHWESCGPPPP